MNRITKQLLIGFMATLLPLGAHALNQTSVNQEFERQANVIEYSIKNSSVTPLFSQKKISQKLRLVKNAREQAHSGNMKTAYGLLDEAGSALYDMSDRANDQDNKQVMERLEELDKVLVSLKDAAMRIAFEKSHDPNDLMDLTDLYTTAKAVWAMGDLVNAELLMEHAYIGIQEEIASMRSGDLINVRLPEENSQEGWLDSQRRYQDWAYFASHLILTNTQEGIGTSALERAGEQARSFYEKARIEASNGNWSSASSLLDSAFVVLERSWRGIGLDV